MIAEPQSYSEHARKMEWMKSEFGSAINLKCSFSKHINDSINSQANWIYHIGKYSPCQVEKRSHSTWFRYTVHTFSLNILDLRIDRSNIEPYFICSGNDFKVCIWRTQTHIQWWIANKIAKVIGNLKLQIWLLLIFHSKTPYVHFMLQNSTKSRICLIYFHKTKEEL